jgi:hypothetical protein
VLLLHVPPQLLLPAASLLAPCILTLQQLKLPCCTTSLLALLLLLQWGGRNIRAGSNIVFSNGLLDPWHGGGVMQDVSKSLVAVVIPEVSHETRLECLL